MVMLAKVKCPYIVHQTSRSVNHIIPSYRGLLYSQKRFEPGPVKADHDLSPNVDHRHAHLT